MPDDQQATRLGLARELRQALVPELLERWYPQVVDEEFGGFYSNLSLNFEVQGEQQKPLVTQARHVWTSSKAALFLPDDSRYPRVAEHGFRYLRDVMWDRAHGGFLPRVYARSSDGVWPGAGSAGDRGLAGRAARFLRAMASNRGTRPVLGRILGRRRGARRAMVKDGYDQAFAIYGLAAYYAFSEDPEALDLASRVFGWMEEHSHDPDHGGYFRYLKRDGSPFDAGPRGQPPKDLDTTLHLLEAFSELYQVWPDDLLRRRLEELLHLLRDRMTSERGTSWVSFTADWTPVRLTAEDRLSRNFASDHVSFGHDIETAALLIEASEVLGLEEDAATNAVAKRLVDHSLDHGWDAEHGGLYEAGYYFTDDGPCEIVIDTKIYWAQAEALNTLSLMANLYPDDPHHYLQLFEAQWRYCDRFLLDHDRGGWYLYGLDTVPLADQPGKASPLRGTYHAGRALMNSLERLSPQHSM